MGKCFLMCCLLLSLAGQSQDRVCEEYAVADSLRVPLAGQLQERGSEGCSGTGRLPLPLEVPSQERISAGYIEAGRSEDTMKHYYRLNKAYLSSYPESFAFTVSRPFHWKGRDWAKAGVVLGAIGGLMLADEDIRHFVQVNRTGTVNKVFNTIEPLGNRYTPYLLLSAFAAAKITGNERLEHVALTGTRALLSSVAVYTSIKGFTRRLRPDSAATAFIFGPPFKKEFTSFPSGHTNTVFSVATAIALEYKDVKWVPWVSYSLASLTGISRIVQNRHWTSDVLAGALIGHFVTRGLYLWEEKRNGHGKKLKASL